MSDGRELTGRKVLAIAVAAFGLVIAANVAMMVAATGTFPGLVVKNSYVASQHWQAEADAQKALGWKVEIAFSDGALRVVPRGADGALVPGLVLEATIGRPTRSTEDVTLTLSADGQGYAAPLVLAPGAWRIEVKTLDGPAFRASANLLVAE